MRTHFAFAFVFAVVACGGEESTGVVTFTGLTSTDVAAPPIAAFAYSGNYNGVLNFADVIFYSENEQSCDGPWEGNAQPLDISDLVIVPLPNHPLEAGTTIQLVPDAQAAATSFLQTEPIATLTYNGTDRFIRASQSGTLTLTVAESGHLHGTLTAQMGVSPDETKLVTVDFDAPACSSLW